MVNNKHNNNIHMPVKHCPSIQYSMPASDCKDGKSHQNDSASLGHSEIHREIHRLGREREITYGKLVAN